MGFIDLGWKCDTILCFIQWISDQTSGFMISYDGKDLNGITTQSANNCNRFSIFEVSSRDLLGLVFKWISMNTSTEPTNITSNFFRAHFETHDSPSHFDAPMAMHPL